MAENDVKQTIVANLKEILPHKSEPFIDDLGTFLINEGVISECDLRFMTVPILKAKLSTVDASRVYEAWQAKYVTSSNQNNSAVLAPVQQPISTPSNSCNASSSRASSSRASNDRSSRIPVFTSIDCPFIPAGVRKAIIDKKRPKPNELEDFVIRIVDHTFEQVPDMQRNEFPAIADSIVLKWKDSFQDTIITDKEKKGSSALRRQILIRYDNIKRKDRTRLFLENNTNDAPQAYGCINWSPELPEGQTEETQEDIRKTLKKIYDLGKRRWDRKTIKNHLEDSFFLQRKELNAGVEVEPTDKRKSRKRKANALPEAPPAAEVVPLRTHIDRWPFLIEVEGMSFHFKTLTGVDFEKNINTFIESEAKLLMEFLSCKSTALNKLRRTMTRHEEESHIPSFEVKLPSLLQMLIEYFKEDLDALFIIVEETIGFDEVTEELMKSQVAPKDGAPFLVISGTSPYDFKDIFFFIDNTVLTSVPTWKEAILVLFQSHFVFNLLYSTKLQVLMSYIQRCIADINPERGNKCVSSAEEKKAMTKAVKLSNQFSQFKQTEMEEAQKENRSSK